MLEFPGKQPGDIVQVTLSKPGYVVVNSFQLRVTLPEGTDAEPLTLIICKEAEREEWAEIFFRLKGARAAEETYKRRIGELEQTNQQSVAAMAKLRAERDQAIALADKASAEFARLKPAETTDIYQSAMSLFLNGKVQDALLVLDEKKLQESLEDATAKEGGRGEGGGRSNSRLLA